MSVAVVIETESEVPALLGWAWMLARSRGVDVKVLYAGGKGASEDDPPAVAARAAISELVDRHARLAAMEAEVRGEVRGEAAREPPVPERCPEFEVLAIKDGHRAQGVLDAAEEHGVKLLVVAKHQIDRSDNPLPAQLFRRAHCVVLLLRPGAAAGQRCQRILVPTAGGPHATEALRLAEGLASVSDASCHIDQQAPAGVDALYVEPNVGPESQAVGEKILGKAVRKALGDPSGQARVRPVVHLADDFRQGVAEVAGSGGYDLVLLGAANRWHARKALFGSVPDKLMTDPDSALTLGVVRRAVPKMEAATEALRRRLRRVVPQLERDDRIDLVERVQNASRWDFDFVALICLSTLIATLGLMQDSVAVVIGAMLVAPLMTPLIGCGLSVVQGNGRLIREASRSVLLGFLLALSLAAVMGALVPHAGLTPQMLARGQPNVLDLGVAFVSGVAAAYASSRPNLSGALPGVAIAAALIPPISTSGVALTHGDFVTSAGAALLFITNIVAIVLGAAITLYAVGMQARHLHTVQKRWTRHATMTLVILAVLLSVPLCYWLYASLPKYRVPESLREQVVARVEAVPNTRWVALRCEGVRGGTLGIELTLQSPAAVDQALAQEVDALFEDYFDRPCEVRVVTHLITESVEE